LKHNAVPVELSEKDIEVILSGKGLLKVVYLPDEPADADAPQGVEPLISWRLEPGVDPVVEADRRGAILAILRAGGQRVKTPTSAEK
jgi:hypothetical protein